LSEEKPRQIAVQVLEQRQASRAHLEDSLESRLSRAHLSHADRALCQTLVYGITRWERTLDWLIDRKTPGKKQKTMVRALLQLGLFQMFWLDRIPDHAAVNETVELAKQAGLNNQAGFVNAVLRAYTRERAQTRTLLEEIKLSDPALAHSHPAWLFERWRLRWGTERAVQLMSWNNLPPPTFARLNRLKTDAAALASAWTNEGVQFSPANWDWTKSDDVFRLESHPPLDQLPSFKSGLFYVQDPSTLLSVRWLGPKPGESVLDLCAAPGGKTALIAQFMGNQGTILAQDSDDQRLQMVKENCARLGVTCVETALAPEIQHTLPSSTSSNPQSAIRNPQSVTDVQPVPSKNLQFDRVLVDAPCSNTGVMRRRIEVRWRLRPAELSKLAALQFELLCRGAAQLKPSGILVYSTCSLEPEENSNLLRQFLDAHRNFALEDQRELLPFVDRVDGAFVSKLRRKS